MLYAVIMAGGAGTRFWPASRKARPKQLLDFGLGRPLVEETIHRINDLIPPERTLIMTNSEYVDIVSELLPELPKRNILGEPACRDTSACIGLAAAVLLKEDPDAVMAVMPSDHIIRPSELFCATLASAAKLLATRKETLVTFGIEPTEPATGFGYIKEGEKVGEYDGTSFFRAKQFHEKPDIAKAKAFLDEGGYYWNAGIFVWRADTVLGCIQRFLPDLHDGLSLIAEKAGTPGFTERLNQVYPGLKKISIDFGVMEKAEDRAVAAVRYFWDDVGSWRALERLLKADSQDNCVQGEFLGIDSSNLIVSARGGMVATVGVEGLIVVHTPDATLVCRKDDAEAVKKVVEQLRDEYR